MEIIKGKYAEAKVFANDLEQYARAQLQMICDNAVSEGSRIRVMPDVHPGKVGTIGLTMTVGKRVIPNLLGIDIGCGVSCMRVSARHVEFEKLDRVVRECVPAGFVLRQKPHRMAAGFAFEKLLAGDSVRYDRAVLSLGTLGGGNHFIEVEQSTAGAHWVTVHTGSRYLGKAVTEYYVEQGARRLKEKGESVPHPMTYLEGDLMEAYLTDVKTVQEYAALNREIILQEIAKGMKWKEEERFSSVHNYVEEAVDGAHRQCILRKGAISAKKGEKVIIPINMRDGVLLGIGKGNADWNESAPHGSGRILRRDEVKNHYTVAAFKQEMKGIYTTSVSADTLDEAPFAYRGLEQILDAVQETVEVTDVLKPVYCFKAGSGKEALQRQEGRRKGAHRK
ncbi:MAG: RtcB family protein [Lachnospiraceae bacterium]|nr:RtcB family protein [Lachnospiraceae bacterium]